MTQFILKAYLADHIKLYQLEKFIDTVICYDIDNYIAIIFSMILYIFRLTLNHSNRFQTDFSQRRTEIVT